MKKIDYTTMGQGNQPQTEGAVNKRWWLSPKKELAQSIVAIVKTLGEFDGKRATQYQISARLYGNTNLTGVNGVSMSKIQSTQAAMKDRISYNVVQSVIDTVTAKISKNKPKPLFLTSGGDHKLQRKAKKLDKFVEGAFYENNAYQLGEVIFRDGAVWGDGLVHVFAKDGRVKYERVLASELYCDWVESFYGEPRQLHRVKNIDREVLVEMFPSHKGAILLVSPAKAESIGAAQNVSDQVTVVESWHIPSGKDAGDGLHCICIENETLFSEEWDKDFFPFARFQWSKRMYGYWGQGLAEQVQNIQLEMNKILWIIQRSMHLAGSFKVFIENGSKVVKEHLNNDIGAIVTYTGVKPEYVVPPIVPIEYYNHFQTLKNSAFEQAGISQLSATSQKPAGLNSGKALREYNDIETERFVTIGHAYENFYMDLAKLTIDCAKGIYEVEGKFEVKAPGKNFVESIDWKDVDMEEDEYFMKVFPVSSLPSDPAGRLQTVQEYVQAGFIGPRQARRLLDFPDLEQIESLQNSTEDYLHEILEKMVDQGEYTAPEPFDDLALARELALEYYSQGKRNKLDEDKLDLLRQFMDQLTMLQQQAMPPQQPGMPAGPAPQANPMPAPTSDMIQNTPMA